MPFEQVDSIPYPPKRAATQKQVTTSKRRRGLFREDIEAFLKTAPTVKCAKVIPHPEHKDKPVASIYQGYKVAASFGKFPVNVVHIAGVIYLEKGDK